MTTLSMQTLELLFTHGMLMKEKEEKDEKIHTSCYRSCIFFYEHSLPGRNFVKI
jgi:hypothetical protein